MSDEPIASPPPAEAETYERRGVENPRIIDLLTTDTERGEVVLAILEGRPWGSVPEQMQQLEDKLNSYFGYVLDGHLGHQYPDYAGLPVLIRLDCVEPPGEEEEPYLRAVRRFCADNGLRWFVRVVDDPFVHHVPWEG